MIAVWVWVSCFYIWVSLIIVVQLGSLIMHLHWNASSRRSCSRWNSGQAFKLQLLRGVYWCGMKYISTVLAPVPTTYSGRGFCQTRNIFPLQIHATLFLAHQAMWRYASCFVSTIEHRRLLPDSSALLPVTCFLLYTHPPLPLSGPNKA
jgi:hypothetical protein